MACKRKISFIKCGVLAVFCRQIMKTCPEEVKTATGVKGTRKQIEGYKKKKKGRNTGKRFIWIKTRGTSSS